MLERAALGLFRHGDGILEHPLLAGAHARAASSGSRWRGIIAYIEVEAAVGGEHDRLVRDEVIVQPARGGADEEAGDEQDGGQRGRRQESRGLPSLPILELGFAPDRRQRQRDQEEDRRDDHRLEADQDADGQPGRPDGEPARSAGAISSQTQYQKAATARAVGISTAEKACAGW